MANDGRTIHQLVHGYVRGHRLLASSADLSADILSIINRASDAVPNFRPSSGPYMTGYGLPDGSWALSRTWPITDADRPNTVWSHTLLVPSAIVGRVSAAALVGQFRPPDPTAEYDAFRIPIPMTLLSSLPARTTMTAALAGVAVYRQAEVTLDGLTREERESLALALWDQHWMPIRRGFNFCTAPDVSLFEARARCLLFTSRSRGPRHTAETPAIVAADLCDRTPFRQWLHFVGSGERDPALIETFARVYDLLHDAEPDIDAIRRAQELLGEAGPVPGELRRLKRRLLSFDKDRPRWPVAPDLVLGALAHERLGDMTSAEDASLQDWIALAWQNDPVQTARLLADARAQRMRHYQSESEERQPAKGAMSAAFDDAIGTLITPPTVAAAAELSPERLLAVLIDRSDWELWRSWARLPADVRVRTIAAPVQLPTDWAPAVAGVRVEPDALRELLVAFPNAVKALIDLVADTPSEGDVDLYPLPDTAARIVGESLETETEPARIRAVSYLAASSRLPKGVHWSPWIQTMKGGRDDVVAAIAYLLGRRAAEKEGLELAALALAHLYPLLAHTSATGVWERLANSITGHKGDWDRCRRLAVDFAKSVAKQDNDTATWLIGLVDKRHTPAAQAIADALRQKRSNSMWKIVADFFQW